MTGVIELEERTSLTLHLACCTSLVLIIIIFAIDLNRIWFVSFANNFSRPPAGPDPLLNLWS